MVLCIQKRKGGIKMDSPISWGILVILAILAAYWFLKKIDEEQETRKHESDDTFFGR
jgi:hypothetical protein